jgi:hypothetical protein
MHEHPVKVVIERHHNALFIGSTAFVIGFDFVPWCEASRRNPLLDLVIADSGYETTAQFADVRLH